MNCHDSYCPFVLSHGCGSQKDFDPAAPCMTSLPVIILPEDVFCSEDGDSDIADVKLHRLMCAELQAAKKKKKKLQATGVTSRVE